VLGGGRELGGGAGSLDMILAEIIVCRSVGRNSQKSARY